MYFLGDTQCAAGDVIVATSGSPICLSPSEAAAYSQQVGQMSPQDQAAYFGGGPSPSFSLFGLSAAGTLLAIAVVLLVMSRR